MKISNGRLWATINNGEIEIRSLTQSELEEALNILDKSFYLRESVCNACGINLPENHQARQELSELCRITAEDGVSLVAKDTTNGKIVSVAFNKIQYVPENSDEDAFFTKFRKEQTHAPQSQRLMDFMIEVDAETDVFEMFHMDCVCELMFLATLAEYERKGIGRALTKYTIDLTRELSQGQGVDSINPKLQMKRPRAVTALFTSKFSQKMGQAIGFKVLNAVPYSRYCYQGKRFDQVIDPLHKTCEHVIHLV